LQAGYEALGDWFGKRQDRDYLPVEASFEDIDNDNEKLV